jgi:HK97 family phage major capsid protein
MDAQKILELKSERKNLTGEIRAHIDSFKDKEMDAEGRAKLESMEKRFDTLNESIQTEERQMERERLAGETRERIAEERKAEPDPVKELRSKFANVLVEGSASAISEYRALQQTNATQAGYLVAPQQFVAELIADIDNEFLIRGLSRRFQLTKAQSLGFPKRTARMARAVRGGEIQAPTADTTLAFGKREFIPKWMTAECLVSRPLLRNSALDADALVRGELAYAFGEAQEMEYMTGDGATQALGVFTASADGISTARDVSTGNAATEIKFDGLKEAKYSIKAGYWPGLRWLFHRDAVKQIAKIKDGNGQYIWADSVKAGEPDMLLGFPVGMSEYAPNTFTSGLYVGILGNFQKGYWIADSLAMEIQVLTELYARTNQVDYIARLENDAMPVIEEAFARVKLA